MTIIKYQPTTQIINAQGAKTPCIARIYKDGQWRQCCINYYRLYPLISAAINQQIVDINNQPIYVAKKEI